VVWHELHYLSRESEKMADCEKSRKSLIWILWLVCAGQACAANWAATGMSDEVEYGIDRSSIERKGDIRTVWTMLDYRKVQYNSLGKPYWSTKALIEMNCSNRQVRTRSLAYYSGPKLTGEQLSKEGVFDQWRQPPSNSPVSNIMKSLCEPH
jgi:hypothetical protein